jgi:hypothetical protein
MIWMSMIGCVPAATGCNAEEGDCAGSLAVDLDGERPVFRLEGMEDAGLLPNAFDIIVCPESVAIWDMWSLEPGAFPLTWGEVPENSEHVEAPNEDFPFELVEGTMYAASLGVREKDVDGPLSFVQNVTNYGTGQSGISGWSASFVWGDPASFVSDGSCGGEDSGVTAP